VHLYWFIPSHGDGHDLAGPATAARRRTPDPSYLAQVAQAAELTGFTGALVPAGLFCEDHWVTATALAVRTTRLKFMVAIRPDQIVPTSVAQMAATFQRVSGGRLLLNVVTGGDPEEQRRYGDWLAHDERYDRTGEFLTVMRGAAAGRFEFSGKHYQVAGATVIRPADETVPVFLGGSSAAALRTAAAHADVYLCWGEPPSRIAEQTDRLDRAAAGSDRRPEVGTRLHVIARRRAEDAWEEARRSIENLDPEQAERARRRMAAADSEGQRRMNSLRDDPAALAGHPDLWAGYSLVRQGPGLTVVGSYEQVAERLADYHAAGVRHLILSAQPHLEAAYEFGEGVLPLLRSAGVVSDPDQPVLSAAVAGALR
jgi:alkanesulfonate monooxygenase